MPAPDAIPELLMERARAGDESARPLARALPQLPAADGPRLDQPALARPARRLRPGAGDLPQGPSRLSPVPGLDRARAGRLAAADPGPQPGRPGQAAPGRGAGLPAGRGPGSHARSLQPGGPSSALAAPLSSPSSIASRREQAVLLADALEKLPADYREVFILRNLEHIPFDQIAARMGRSSVRCASSGRGPCWRSSECWRNRRMNRRNDAAVDRPTMPAPMSLDESEVARVFDAYLADLEAGRAVDPDGCWPTTPAIAEQLRACLEVMHLADQMAGGSGAARSSTTRPRPRSPQCQRCTDSGRRWTWARAAASARPAPRAAR